MKVLTRLGTPGEIGPLALVKLWVTSVIAASWPAGRLDPHKRREAKPRIRGGGKQHKKKDS